jgi:hypothetical protein
MGVAGLLACTGTMLAEKACSKQDKKILNGAIAAASVGNAALFGFNGMMKDDVRPVIRGLNIATNLAVAGFAAKKAME